MAAEVTLKEESALEIGKQLAFSFQGLQAVGADTCLLYTSPSPRDLAQSRMPSSA